jgi:non-homologous end joining protein Ku
LVRGFEYAKGKYIQFTEQELEALETEANRNIDLKQFVPVSKVDPLYFDLRDTVKVHRMKLVEINEARKKS